MVLAKTPHTIVEKILVISLIILLAEFLFPHKLYAQTFDHSNELGPVLVRYIEHPDTKEMFMSEQQDITGQQPRLVRWVTVTAYSSTPDQTDDTPFITANGAWVYDGLVATNFLYFGTRVKFPDEFGDKIFTVEDRMNSKYQTRMDIWMPDRQAAQEFGVKYLKVEIY